MISEDDERRLREIAGYLRGKYVLSRRELLAIMLLSGFVALAGAWFADALFRLLP